MVPASSSQSLNLRSQTVRVRVPVVAASVVGQTRALMGSLRRIDPRFPKFYVGDRDGRWRVCSPKGAKRLANVDGWVQCRQGEYANMV